MGFRTTFNAELKMSYFSEVQAITSEHGYKVLVRTGPGRYHWGTCVREEHINPETMRRRKVSTAWYHSRGAITHRSYGIQTNAPATLNIPPRTITSEIPTTAEKSVGGHFVDNSLLRDASTNTDDPVVSTMSVEIQADRKPLVSSVQTETTGLLQACVQLLFDFNM